MDSMVGLAVVKPKAESRAPRTRTPVPLRAFWARAGPADKSPSLRRPVVS